MYMDNVYIHCAYTCICTSCMYMYIYIYKHTHPHTRTHTHTHTTRHAHTHINHTHTHTHYMYIYKNSYTSIYVHIFKTSYIQVYISPLPYIFSHRVHHTERVNTKIFQPSNKKLGTHTCTQAGCPFSCRFGLGYAHPGMILDEP